MKIEIERAIKFISLTRVLRCTSFLENRPWPPIWKFELIGQNWNIDFLYINQIVKRMSNLDFTCHKTFKAYSVCENELGTSKVHSRQHLVKHVVYRVLVSNTCFLKFSKHSQIISWNNQHGEHVAKVKLFSVGHHSLAKKAQKVVNK